MRIYFERSGGFMGTLISRTIDTEALADEDAHNLMELFKGAQLFDLTESAPSMPGADQFQYKLVIEDAQRKYTLETSDTAAPEGIKPLLRRLTVLARTAAKPQSPD